MDNNNFNRSHFLNVTLREVERRAWTPTFTGVQSVSGNVGYSGIQTAMGPSRSPGGITRALTAGGRATRVRHALQDSQQDAVSLLDQKYRNIRIDTVAHLLLSACMDLGLALGSKLVTPSGSVALGLGATSDMPRLLASFWGLKSIAPMLGTGIATKLSDYDDAFKNAWGPRHPQTTQNDRLMESSAARSFARGHVVAVTALLSGIVAYAKRGPDAPAKLLAQLDPEIQKSPHLGASFAHWLRQQQAEILAHPLLNRRADGLPGEGEAPAPVSFPARGMAAPVAAPAPVPEFNPVDTMDHDVQAAAMVRAAANGTPFCAVCEAAKAAA